MQYFDTLPKVIQTTPQGNSIVLTNLLARASIITDLLKNPVMYYTYDIQDGDTPEIIAYKYYGDMYRYWIVLFANQILDPQWKWPMSQNVFDNYLAEKYPSTNVYTTVYAYEKIITQYEVNTNTTTVKRIQITQEAYNSLMPETDTYTFPTGSVRVSISKRIISIYDYENELNESNRNIRILRSLYVDQIESQFKSLMAQ